ncbi:hypothetical protein [Streptomyces aurantiogriseus]|uniref:Uncharacterized protein n=1 Tax=Streptomyces aurantiogriseus TaxID=66870 RepID=A0A918FG53_9ACTN|nr:hypothetical protein [Streptomyces aurantiogriseus]GGR35678.1 hypothetical protein GCM10010251_60130 [Streptomyces aurantiogriseus]
MPTPRATFLSAFAAALADRLPGTWTSEYHRHTAYEDQFPSVERLWDAGHVDYIVSQHVLGHDVVLHGPHGQELYVTDRPLYRHQFVVAALEPKGFTLHQISPVREPNGIAVPNDPVRATVAVVRRLLPRYQHALAAVRDNARHLHSPVHRTAPHAVTETVMFTWHRDGTFATPYDSVPAEVRNLLYGYGFQYCPRDSALLLPAVLDGVDEGLSRIQSVARRLADHGFGMNVRPDQPVPPTPPPPPATTPKRRR